VDCVGMCGEYLLEGSKIGNLRGLSETESFTSREAG
jgi:hypothetical protein